MKVRTSLIIQQITILDSGMDIAFLLEEDGSIIGKGISTLPLEKHLETLAKRYLDCDTSWLEYTLFTVQDESCLDLVYFTSIPFAVDKKRGKWYSLDKVENVQIQELLFKTTGQIQQTAYRFSPSR